MSDLLELPRDVLDTAATEDIVHYYCCDETLSRCGLDISHEPEVAQAAPHRYCVVCKTYLGTPCSHPDCPQRAGRRS